MSFHFCDDENWQMYVVYFRPLSGAKVAFVTLVFFGAIAFQMMANSRPDPSAHLVAMAKAEEQRSKAEEAEFAHSCYVFGLNDGDYYVFQHPLAHHPEKCPVGTSALRAKLGPPDPKERLALRKDIWKDSILHIQADIDYACKKNGWPEGYQPAHFGPDLFACYKKHPEPT